jgi:hypothetical protein
MNLAAPDGLDLLLARLHERRAAVHHLPGFPSAFGPMAAWLSFAAGGGPAISFEPDEPECGLFRRRLVREGQFVPTAIFRSENILWAWIDDELVKIEGDPFFFADSITEKRFLRMHDQRLAAIASGDRNHWRLLTRGPLNLATTIKGSGNDGPRTRAGDRP